MMSASPLQKMIRLIASCAHVSRGDIQQVAFVCRAVCDSSSGTGAFVHDCNRRGRILAQKLGCKGNSTETATDNRYGKRDILAMFMRSHNGHLRSVVGRMARGRTELSL